MCLVDKEIVTIMFVCREEGKRGVSSQVVCGIILCIFVLFCLLNYALLSSISASRV